MFLYNKLDGTIPLSNLMFYQRFNNSVADQTGNYSVSSSGVTYGNGLYSGVSNESIVLYSLTDSINIASTADFTFGNGTVDLPFSVSFTFKAINLGVLNGGFYNKFLLCNRDNSSDTTKKVWQINTNNSPEPKLNFIFFYQSTGGNKGISCDTILSNNVTYHITCTYSTLAGMKIYINGTLQTSTAATNGTYVAKESFSNSIKIGGASWFDDLVMLGNLDGLGIWNVALNHRQVKAIFNKQASGLEIL